MSDDPENHERSAAGMDYDFPIREKASKLGNAIAENGPEALFEEIENLLPETWREQIAAFPIAAVLLGVGVGVWLGMRKGDEIIAAGTSMITAAAVSNVTRVMEHATGES
jgi:ABC-type antimicrobial peptide transport system permease subunit